MAVPAADLAFRDPRRPGTVARFLIGLLVIVDVARAVVPALRFGPAADVINPPRVLLELAAGVFFLVWARRCHLNAEFLTPGALRPGSDWAVLMWLLPPVSWWAPRRQLLGVWRAAGATPDARLVNAWWVVWLGNMAVGVGGTIYSAVSHRVDGTAVTVVGAVLYCVAGILVVTLIGRISAAQTAAFTTPA